MPEKNYIDKLFTSIKQLQKEYVVGVDDILDNELVDTWKQYTYLHKASSEPYHISMMK